jgi:hypothetical protein
MKRHDMEQELKNVRDAMRSHHAGVTPDACFAERVRARLRPEPTAMLGWAAFRVLPATFAILAVLTWAVFSSTPVETNLQAGTGSAATVRSPSEDIFAWVLEDGENGS